MDTARSLRGTFLRLLCDRDRCRSVLPDSISRHHVARVTDGDEHSREPKTRPSSPCVIVTAGGRSIRPSQERNENYSRVPEFRLSSATISSFCGESMNPIATAGPRSGSDYVE